MIKLYPDNQTEIVMSEFGFVSSSGYYFQVGTLELNETERQEIIYSKYKVGGKDVDYNYPLVDINFDVLVYASTRSELLQLVANFKRGVSDVDGILEYVPSDTTISTFYRYFQSRIPAVKIRDINNWDNRITKDQKFVIMLSVTLKTYPFGFSNYDSITQYNSKANISLTSPVTINNGFVVGDSDAYLDFRLENSSSKTISEIVIFGLNNSDRDLNNTIVTRTAEAASVTGTGWSTIGGSAARLSTTTVRRLTVSDTSTSTITFNSLTNESDNRGEVAIYCVADANSGVSLFNWKFKLGLNINGVRVWTSRESYAPNIGDVFEAFYVGNINLPVINVDSLSLSSVQLALDITNSEQDGEIDIDGIILVWEDFTVIRLEVNTPLGSNDMIQYKLDKNFDRVYYSSNNDGVYIDYIKSVFGDKTLKAKNIQNRYWCFYINSDGSIDFNGGPLAITFYVTDLCVYPLYYDNTGTVTNVSVTNLSGSLSFAVTVTGYADFIITSSQFDPVTVRRSGTNTIIVLNTPGSGSYTVTDLNGNTLFAGSW